MKAPRSWSWLLGLVPLFGLAELGLQQYFARRAPGFQDYAALAPQLLKLKPPGVPVVVAPFWAEPFVRQAAPKAFPLDELARADDSDFEQFLEVSLLGAHAPELAAFPLERSWSVGRFALNLRTNPRATPPLFDFVAAVAGGQVEVFADSNGQREVCPLVTNAHSITGGLHGHVAYPRQRFECRRNSFVGVTLLDDQDYRPRRCILAQAPVGAKLVLRFGGVPVSQKLQGFAGFSYFLERDQESPEVELGAEQDGVQLGAHGVVGAPGWSRFELAGPHGNGPVEISVRLMHGPQDVCFALGAH